MNLIKITDDEGRVTDVAAIAALGLFAFFALFWSRSQEQLNDALFYVNQAKNGGMAFIPKKLLWDSIIFSINQVMVATLGCDMICTAQIHNIVWAIVAVSCVYLLVKHLTASVTTALFIALFMLASRGFWVFATQTDVYVPVTGSLGLICLILIVREDGPLSIRRLIALSVALLAAILYQQSSVLLVIPIGFYLVATFRQDGIRPFVYLVTITGTISLCIYALAFVYKCDEVTFTTFIAWMLSGANNPNWGTFKNFSLQGLKIITWSQVLNIIKVPAAISFMAKPVTAGMAAVLLFVFMWNVKGVVHRQAQWNVRGFLLIWWAMFTLFLLWWLPPYKQLILANIIPIILLAGFTIRDLLSTWSPGGRGRHTLLVSCGFLLVMFSMSNFLSSVLPLHVSKGSSYAEAEKLSRLVAPGCRIYTRFRDALYLEYYFDRETLWIRSKLRAFYQAENFNQLKQVPQGNICVTIPLKFVSPDHQIGEINLARIDGYKRPERYFAFIEWLFNVENQPNAGSLSYSGFQVFTDENGSSCINIDHNYRRQSRGVLEFLDELDRKIAESRQAAYGVFRDWNDATAGQRLDRMRAKILNH